MSNTSTFFDLVFDHKTEIATVQCPGCGRRLRCSCQWCMENLWTEITNVPGLGFTIVPESLPESDLIAKCDDGTTIELALGDFQQCNDCGYVDHVDGWARRSEDQLEYGPLAASMIEDE